LSPVPTVVRSELSSESPAPQCPPGALDKSSWLQARKVFVGGIPQTIDQNAMYHMFSKIGKVKKAWVQLFHADHDRVPAGKHHRGFGFVIFHEKHSIDQLLGEDSQRFICFGDDLKLEVKRAIGKGGSDKQPSTRANKKPEPTSSQASPAACHNWQSGSSAASSASPQTWENSPSPVPQAWQSCPSQAVLVGFCAYVNVPMVPPFPFAKPAVVQWPCGSNQPQGLQSQPPVGPQHQCQSLSSVLLGERAGQKPLNSQELELALLEAMPDHYDD